MWPKGAVHSYTRQRSPVYWDPAPRAFPPDFLLEEALLAARHESMEVHDSFKSLTDSHNCGRDRNLADDPTSVFVALTLSASADRGFD